MYKNILILLIILIINLFYNAKCEIINTNVIRTIDIKSQLVKIDATITLLNSNPDSINSFIYTIDPDVHDFFIKFKIEQDRVLTFKQIDNNKTYEVFFNQTLPSKSKLTVKSEIVYINKIVPLYKKITFDQDQFVSYKGNLLHYSPYTTLALKTTYLGEFDEDSVFSHTPNESRDNSNTIFYYNKTITPYSFQQLEIEFKSNKPFLIIHNLERIIDVSHFGKIYIEDRIFIGNEGSKLVGPYEHKRSNIEKAASGWWYTHLPTAAENVKYFDIIGNNSKSILLHLKNYKSFKFRPRYPLLSGWKTFYVITYSVPAYQYLYYDLSDYFLLKMRIVDHVLNNAVLRNVSIKVLLPEAAEINQVSTPFGFERLQDEMRYTDLSTFGRPTLSFTGSNILENHIASFTVEYLFPTRYLIRAPLMIVLYLQSVFLVFIIISRLQ